FPTHLSSRNWVEGQITDLRPMIRNGMGQLYIPGSSIKGAIRTAIAYHLLKHENQYHVPQNKRRSEIEKQLQASMGDLRDKTKAKFYDDKAFMDELFTNFSLVGNRGSDKTGPNTDFMRAIHVTDSDPLEKKTLTAKSGKKQTFNAAVVSEVVVSSHFEDWKAKSRASIYTELVANARTELTITLDHELLAKFRHKNGMSLPFKDLDKLLSICQEFAQEQWDLEAAYWEKIGYTQNLNFDLLWDKYYAEPNCDHHLRLGWGTGMMGTTINSLLQPDLRSEIRDSCGIKAPGFEAPKSRRTVKNSKGELRYPLGWVKLKKI
ncbi:MAG: type III-A CRISPR-associated RAMP protein Csm5, partial [Spirulina sp. DLM2.Bin59]